MARSFTGSQWLSRVAVASSTPITFACWYNASSIASNCGLISIGNSASNNAWALYAAPAVIRAASIASNVNSFAASAASITTGTWHHCVAVFASSSSRTVYLDGISATNTTSSVPTSVTNTSISGIYDGSATPIDLANGTIAWASVWKTALTATDVLSLFLGAFPTKVQPSQLVFFSELSSGQSPEPDYVLPTGWTLHGTPATVPNPRLFF